MGRILKVLGIVVVILLLIVIAIPFLINANTFRPELEAKLTTALGRQVKVGNLSLSILSGGVAADDISIADDPKFSKTNFVQAKSLKVGVEMMPLIFSRQLNVTDLTLSQPEINLVQSQNGEKWNFSSLGNGNQSEAKSEPTPSTNPNLSVAKLSVVDGRLTVSREGAARKTHVYDKVNVEVSHFSFATSFPFQLNANLPGGGSLKLDGHAGPIDAADAALTPLQAKVDVHQMNLADSGFLDPASGIAGIADFDGTISSDGREVKTSGTLSAEKLKVAQKGSPAGKPVQVKYAVTHNIAKQSGALTHGEVTMGKAVAHLSGFYETKKDVTSINMKVEGQGMPVDDLEAMLPALGVVLPPNSQLKGGTLAVNFSIVGAVDRLLTTGTLKLENSALAGFNLGSKLSAISALSGKTPSANDTNIQNFSSDVRVSPEGTKADNINLIIPALGTLTGAGTVSPQNALDFKMVADSIPFSITGTTSDPKFVPDVKGIAKGFLNNALKGQNGANNPLGGLSGLGGLFKKKKP